MKHSLALGLLLSALLAAPHVLPAPAAASFLKSR